MKTDKTTKILLALIALGLWFNAMAPLFHPTPVVRAADKVTCEGKLKASAYGTTTYPGGYDFEVTCKE